MRFIPLYKMKPIFCIFFSILLVKAVYAWTAIEQTDNSKSHIGYCYSTTNGVGAMELGEIKKQEGQCVQVSCGGGGLITYNGCEVVAASPNKNCKKVKGDLSKPYPNCCSQIKCDTQ